MARPLIVVDRSVPYGAEAFAGLGTLRLADPGDLQRDPGSFRDAAVLVVPSSVRVDAALLAALPRLQAIASPVVGRDHVDAAAVAAAARRAGHPLPVFFAPGSTAAGVADWVLGSLVAAADRLGLDLPRMRVGIWGLGRCGRAVASRLDRLGLRWIAHDPPREARARGAFAGSPREALAGCDAVTIHVPLSGPGESPWPTRDMVDERVLSSLRAGGVRLLLNAARGAVADEAALAAHLASGAAPALVLDVFRGEPAPDPALVAGALLATPHVAGSVLQGRWNAARRVREAVRRHLAIPGAPLPPLPPGGFALPVPCRIPAAPPGPEALQALARAVPVAAWSDGFRADYGRAAPGDRPGAFARWRGQGLRREVRWLPAGVPH